MTNNKNNIHASNLKKRHIMIDPHVDLSVFENEVEDGPAQTLIAERIAHPLFTAPLTPKEMSEMLIANRLQYSDMSVEDDIGEAGYKLWFECEVLMHRLALTVPTSLIEFKILAGILRHEVIGDVPPGKVITQEMRLFLNALASIETYIQNILEEPVHLSQLKEEIAGQPLAVLIKKRNALMDKANAPAETHDMEDNTHHEAFVQTLSDQAQVIEIEISQRKPLTVQDAIIQQAACIGRLRHMENDASGLGA
jgi:hypothetical protein